jgi:hypothetical protein
MSIPVVSRDPVLAAMHLGSDGWRLQNCKNHRLLVGSRVRCMRAFLKPGRIFPQKTSVAFSITRSPPSEKGFHCCCSWYSAMFAIFLFLLYDTFWAIRLGCFSDDVYTVILCKNNYFHLWTSIMQQWRCKEAYWTCEGDPLQGQSHHIQSA